MKVNINKFLIFANMFIYCVSHKKKITKYSQKFTSKRKARIWYNKHGKKLELKFNRKLELVER